MPDAVAHAKKLPRNAARWYYTDDVIEQSTDQKLLWHLLPLLCLLSMAGMLNRLSLGDAAPVLGPSLNIGATQLDVAENLFCAGYLLACLPSVWLLLRFGTTVWVTTIMLATAGVALAHAAVWNAASLYIVHFLLGVTEAGLLPAMVFYLAQWMLERHRAKAIAALIAAAAIVPLLSGEGSDLLMLVARLFGFSDWRSLFILEALPTIWVGLLVPGRTPKAPGDASWLPPSERHWLIDQLRQAVPPGPAPQFADGLRSVPVWKLAAIQGVIGLVGGSLGLWVPLAMQETSYLPTDTAAVVMIAASALGVAVTVVTGLLWYNRTQWRRALAVCLGLTGLCLGAAAVLPFGSADVGLMAFIAAIVPAILALIWVLAPCLLTGAAAAAGFAVLSMAGVLGYYAAAGLAAVLSGTGERCLLLGAACLVAAWLARGMDGRRPAPQRASAVSPGE